MTGFTTVVLIASLILWISSGVLTVFASRGESIRQKTDTTARLLLSLGTACLGLYLGSLWIAYGRPPMRSFGETRLWTAMFLVAIAMTLEFRLKDRTLRMPAICIGCLFLALDAFRPEAFDRTLPPALQSPWFVPHVAVYLAGYAVLGLAAGSAVWTLIRARFVRTGMMEEDVARLKTLIQTGTALLTTGMVMGALWAKTAWGDYWTWDPKETWAFISWAGYVALLHTGWKRGRNARTTLLLCVVCFLGILACWFIVNVLPSASSSAHAYTN
ncbi:MAG: cytochrome c biogenesis protein CcsA [Planctomycetota bacterium]